MAVSYYLRPKEPKKLLLVDGGRHDPNFVTLCYWCLNSSSFLNSHNLIALSCVLLPESESIVIVEKESLEIHTKSSRYKVPGVQKVFF